VVATVDRLHTTSYQSAIVTITVTCTTVELFEVENIVTLKSGLEVTQRHRKLYHLKA